MRTSRLFRYLAAALRSGAPFVLLSLAAVPAPAQQPPDTALPPSFEVVARARLVSDSATAAERDVARLAVIGGTAAELQESARRQAELQALLRSLLDTDYVRPERLSRLGDQAILENQRLDAHRDRVAERLQQLGEIRARWLERQRFWRAWRTALRADADYNLVAADLQHGVTRVQSVLEAVSAATTELMGVQQRIEELRTGAEEIAVVVTEARSERRRELLQRTAPVLLSPAHRAAVATHGWRPSFVSGASAGAWQAFLREHAGMLLFHAALVVLIAVLARRVYGAATHDAAWAGLLSRPWALALFASTALALQRVVLAPPLWDTLLWALLGLTGVMITRRIFPLAALRRAVYLLAVFYPLFLLLELVRFPAPLFSLVHAAGAAVAFVVFVAAARAQAAAALPAERTVAAEARRVWPLRAGAAIWAIVFAAAVLGYDTLARWITHATVTSAAVLFGVVLLVIVLRGALATLLRHETRERPRTLRRIGLPLVQRLMVLLQVVLITAAVLVLLDIWELGPSPLATWQRLTAFGFALGPVRLTVGRVLFGLAVIYIAVVISWLFRTLIQSEFYRRWDFDRGVAESINTLVHYVLITLGVIFALAVLGVELQNFAIVAGALGIGIGFGLQNIVNNFVSGLILLFERPVRVGDTVIVGGEWGTITKIGLRSTIMLTFDQSEMIVPNADLISEKVTNWTLSNPVARVIMPVGVAYGSDIGQVLAILRAAGTAHESVLPEPPPQALFVGFGESSLDFELRCWVSEIRLRLEVRSAVLAEVERRLAEAGVEIPFPQRDLHIRSIAPEAAGTLGR